MPSISDSQKENIEEMYQDEQMSMREIASELNVSLNAVVYFMRKHSISRRDHKAANVAAFDRKTPSFHKKENLSEEAKKLKSMGAMLYWCEGYSTEKSNMIDFANSDPEMVRLFLRFLRTCYQISEDKLRVYLYCYSNQDVQELISFWSQATNIPKKQFQKPYLRDDFSEDGREMSYGMVHIRYYDKKLLNDLQNLIELEKQMYL